MVINENVKRKIIPIAGGKGGVGKTFIAANLATELAKNGKDTIVIDTADAVLVADKAHSQDVKKVVEWLKKQNRNEHLSSWAEAATNRISSR